LISESEVTAARARRAGRDRLVANPTRAQRGGLRPRRGPRHAVIGTRYRRLDIGAQVARRRRGHRARVARRADGLCGWNPARHPVCVAFVCQAWYPPAARLAVNTRSRSLGAWSPSRDEIGVLAALQR
jgi:hypothetical protein